MRSVLLITLSTLFANSLFSQGQRELWVNGKPINSNQCAEIRMVKMIPEISAGFICEVRNAEIIEDCLELTVVYGGCNGNLELLTDQFISDDLKFTVKPKWIEPSFCKALMLTKVSFDLKPYKNVIQEKNAMIIVAGTIFELHYN